MTAALFRGERAALACAMLSLPLAMCPAPVAAGEMYLSAGGGGGLSDAWSWQTLSWVEEVRKSCERMGVVTQDEFHKLSRKVLDMEKRLKTLEK